MEFCTTCGFLLPLELINQSLVCRACSNSIRDQSQNCNCSFCYKKHDDVGNQFSSSMEQEDLVDCPSEKGKSDRLKSKSRRSRVKQNSDWEHNQPGIPTTVPVSNSGQWHNLVCGTMEDNNDFFVDTHDATTEKDWAEVKERLSVNEVFGDHDFPILGRQLKEDSVEEQIRADWEREQNAYKKCLSLKDTLDITRMVSGHRRKSNNRHFYIGGVDISFYNGTDDAVACLSVVSLPRLELVYQAMKKVKLTQPYIPGFLAFREVPALMDVFSDLKLNAPHYTPDVMMVDGNGILHPRGFGIASQLGVLIDIPTIGVAKSLITAQGISEDMEHKNKKQSLKEAGDGFDLISKETGQVLGKCVRVHDQAPNPVYVSVGHKISLSSAIWIVLECSKYRIPEPIRRADLDSREYIRQNKSEPEVFIK